MLIAHLPAGYLLNKLAWKKSKWFQSRSQWRVFCLVGLVASVLPDLDLFYFFLVDQRQHNHHTYWPHIPAIWIGLFLVSYVVIKLIRKGQWMPYLLIFYFNILLHLILDTLVGGIAWAYPFDARLISVFSVPASESHWLLSFIWHWSFLVELLLIYVAANVFARSGQDSEVDRAVTDAATQKLVSADPI